jgi:cytochrome c
MSPSITNVTLRYSLFSLPFIAAAFISTAKAADPARGAGLYESKCGGCHALDENRYGPAHRGVFGRKAGSAPGYGYSEALSTSSIVWRADTLERWLADPEKLIPGQKMNVSVASAQDRLDLIAYLQAQSRK